MVLVGGDSSAKQRNEIYKGVDIVTGTPGKLHVRFETMSCVLKRTSLQEFIMSGELCLSQVRFFVLDEAVRFECEASLGRRSNLAGCASQARSRSAHSNNAPANTKNDARWQTPADGHLLSDIARLCREEISGEWARFGFI